MVGKVEVNIIMYFELFPTYTGKLKSQCTCPVKGAGWDKNWKDFKFTFQADPWHRDDLQ